MIVPLTLIDFSTAPRSSTATRGVVDEPDPRGGLGRMTYGELAAMARSSPRPSTRSARGTGARVAIVSPNCSRFLLELFGASANGRVLVPVNYRLKPDEIGYILEHSGATLSRRSRARRTRRTCTLNIVSSSVASPIRSCSRSPTGRRGQETDEQATGRSTTRRGRPRPKGVELTHRGRWFNAVVFGWHMGVSDRDVYLHTLPKFHCNGWGMP